MLPASNRGAGSSIAFPDVCNTPAGPATVPVPYPNVAMNAQAAGFSPTVKVSMVNALNMASVIPMTNGDQAGVAHPTIMGAATYTAGNPTVFIDKLPGISLTSPTTGNNMNAPVGAVLVPSAVNVFYSQLTPATATASVATDSAGAWLDDLRASMGALDDAEVSAHLLPTGAPGGPKHDVLWIRIGAFAADVARKLHVATAGGEPAPDTVVIDLRDNPGGELMAALDLAADFVPRGTLVGSLTDADGDLQEVVTTRDPRFSGDVVLWVDERTASAAEAFVRGVRAGGRAIVMGRRTFGKDYAVTLGEDAGGTPSMRPALRTSRGEAGDATSAAIVPDVALDDASVEEGTRTARAAWYAAVVARDATSLDRAVLHDRSTRKAGSSAGGDGRSGLR